MSVGKLWAIRGTRVTHDLSTRSLATFTLCPHGVRKPKLALNWHINLLAHYNAHMRTYFNDIDTLHRFTMELDCHQHELECLICFKNNQFISHGYVYRHLSIEKKVIVGKRIFCSNRHGNSGCGATRRLYLTEFIPLLHYTTAHLFTFLCSLIALSSIQQAYQVATGTEDPRNAYRWLHKLNHKLIVFRSGLTKHAAHIAERFKTRTRRLQLLLPTLHTLFSNLPTNPCADYQHFQQAAFI